MKAHNKIVCALSEKEISYFIIYFSAMSKNIVRIPMALTSDVLMYLLKIIISRWFTIIKRRKVLL